MKCTQFKRVSSITSSFEKGKVYDTYLETRRGVRKYYFDSKYGFPHHWGISVNINSKIWTLVPMTENELEKEINMSSLGKALDIETVTLVDGRKLSDFSASDIVSLINKENTSVKTLNEVLNSVVNSSGIRAMKATHMGNIAILAGELDRRHPE